MSNIVPGAPRDTSGGLVARIVETPHLAQAVPHLPPGLLHRIIQSCGLEDCAELVALATPAQLSAVFDLHLWRTVRPGADEDFDPTRFGVWLELLAESGPAFAAQRLAEVDGALVTAAFGEFVTVFDPAATLPVATDGDAVGIDDALRAGFHCEIGGYIVVAKRTDAWDAVVAVLIALDKEHHERFHDVMAGCRRLSNSGREDDGLDNLLSEAEQVQFDLAVERERRREEQGYVTHAQARAFLQASRQIRLTQKRMPPDDPIAAAYFRGFGSIAGADEGAIPTDPSAADQVATTPAVAALVDMLSNAGVLPAAPRALLNAADGRAARLGRIVEQMLFVQDHDPASHSLRTQELGFLANVLLAGCSLQGRSFTAQEASDATLATCNLGLENWPAQWLPHQGFPADFLVSHPLAAVFQVGWTVLYKNVSMFVATQLLTTLADLRCSDRDIQAGLNRLRRDLAKQSKAGVPWHAREAFDVLASLDTPTWAALVALIGECPVALVNVRAPGTSRPLSIDVSAFEFISENSQIAAVQGFMQSVPASLAG